MFKDIQQNYLKTTQELQQIKHKIVADRLSFI